MKWLIMRRCGSTINYAAFIAVYYIYMSGSLRMSPSEIGLVYAVLLFSNQIFALPAGMIGDRLGFRVPMILGCFIDAGSYFTLAMSATAVGAFVAVFGIGLGGCLFSTNARAELLSYTTGDKSRTALVQGDFLRWSNIGALIGPMVGFVILKGNLERSPFFLFGAVELLLMIPVLMERTKKGKGVLEPTNQLKEIEAPASAGYWHQFLWLHLIGAIPVGLAASAPVVFPYIFDNILQLPADNSIAQLVRSFVVIVLQAWFSVRLISNARITTSLVTSGFLLICLIGLATFSTNSMWLFALSGLFGICQVMATTAIYNGVIFIGTPKGKATAFGLSKLVLAVSTFCILRFVPSLLSAWQSSFQDHHVLVISLLLVTLVLTFIVVSFKFAAEKEA